jgi:hypothetical protein
MVAVVLLIMELEFSLHLLEVIMMMMSPAIKRMSLLKTSIILEARRSFVGMDVNVDVVVVVGGPKVGKLKIVILILMQNLKCVVEVVVEDDLRELEEAIMEHMDADDWTTPRTTPWTTARSSPGSSTSASTR